METEAQFQIRQDTPTAQKGCWCLLCDKEEMIGFLAVRGFPASLREGLVDFSARTREQQQNIKFN